MNWPRDTAAVARSLAKADAWFWLDGTAAEPGGPAGVSYLGEAQCVLQASRGHEHEFLEELRDGSRELTGDLGCVVALSYEFGVGMMGEDPALDDVPPAFALRPSTVLVLDHASGTAELRGEDEAEIDAWLRRHGVALNEAPRELLAANGQAASSRGARAPTAGPSIEDSHGTVPPSWRRSDAQYLADVQACKHAIHEGNAYVLCLTDTAEITGIDIDPLSLYLELLAGEAAVRGAVIVAGDRALVSASPERFLSKRGQNLATHPIKGTRVRGETPEADAILAAELAADPKERAENLMIVDLMRNDLSEVCVPGSVHTDGFLRIESHPRVHQLVSSVTGRIREGADAINAIEACFPGGSMTGAPKRRAVQILATLENMPRGLYSGCFGWLADDGDAELAMSIRCVELRGMRGSAQRALIGAGGGVTSDSDSGRELAEKHLKAASLLFAVSAAEADSQ